jgi:hypothetical protein
MAAKAVRLSLLYGSGVFVVTWIIIQVTRFKYRLTIPIIEKYVNLLRQIVPVDERKPDSFRLYVYDRQHYKHMLYLLPVWALGTG